MCGPEWIPVVKHLLDVIGTVGVFGLIIMMLNALIKLRDKDQ